MAQLEPQANLHAVGEHESTIFATLFVVHAALYCWRHQRPRFWREIAHGISGGGDEHQETSRLPPIGRYVACSVRLPFVPWAVIRSRKAILGRRTLGDRGGKRSKQRREMCQNPLENGSQRRQR